MRKMFLFPLILLMIALTACSFFVKPDKTVTAFFGNLKKADYDKAQKFLSAPVFVDMADAEKKLLGVYFGTMDVANIKVVDHAELAATVSVDITAVDFFRVVQNFMMNMTEKLMNEGLSMDNITDEQLDAILVKELQSPEAPRKTLTALLTMEKTKGKWLITADNNLRAALFLQEFNEDAGLHEGEEGGYSVVDTVNTKAVFTGVDDMMGVCGFKVGGENYQMYCEPEQADELKANYLDKEVNIVYQVLQADVQTDSEEDTATLYILENIIK